LNRPTHSQLRKLIGVANFQFGNNAGELLFGREIQVECSKRTGRIRHVYRGNRLIATLRPKDGYLALTPLGASVLVSKQRHPVNLVVVQNDVADMVKAGGDVFAKHVVNVDETLRPAEEVIVTDENGTLLAVGSAVLSGNDMKYFKRGVAVKVRKGVIALDR
jgi:predicted RNA-binding protein (TIGR00451 family)